MQSTTQKKLWGVCMITVQGEGDSKEQAYESDGDTRGRDGGPGEGWRVGGGGSREGQREHGIGDAEQGS